MSQFFDYDPNTGVQDFFAFDEINGVARIKSVQDVEPLLNRQKLYRDEGLKDRGIKSGLWHYASIPTTVAMELRNKGIDIFNKDHQKAMFKEINTNYPHLKATVKKHAG